MRQFLAEGEIPTDIEKSLNHAIEAQELSGKNTMDLDLSESWT